MKRVKIKEERGNGTGIKELIHGNVGRIFVLAAATSAVPVFAVIVAGRPRSTVSLIETNRN
jgi:hypothetical protein